MPLSGKLNVPIINDISINWLIYAKEINNINDENLIIKSNNIIFDSSHVIFTDISLNNLELSNNLVISGNLDIINSGYLRIDGSYVAISDVVDASMNDLSQNIYDSLNKIITDISDLSNVIYNDLSNQLVSLNHFTDISRLTTSAELIDCSDILFKTITPTSVNKKILVSMDFNYLCSAAYQERIDIQICRSKNSESKILKHNKKLGTKNGAGEYKGNYSCCFTDNPATTNEVKYYVKFQLESNNSQISQGIININNAHDSNNANGSSSITLIEF